MAEEEIIASFADLALHVTGARDASPWYVGRTLYKHTDCGPWMVFIRADARRIYYEDEEASKDPGDIVTVEVGSIVEGSDVEVGPESLDFPFTAEEFDRIVERVDKEADFYWKRDNTLWMHVQKEGQVIGWAKWEEFNLIEVDENLPEDALALLREMDYPESLPHQIGDYLLVEDRIAAEATYL